MFGYVAANHKELEATDAAFYRSVYCGVCRSLQLRYGLKGRIILNYDLAFLALLLLALYDEQPSHAEQRRCLTHPFTRQTQLRSPFCDYAADMTVLLGYYKACDDWQDDKNPAKQLLARQLKPHLPQLEAQYPRQCAATAAYIRDLAEAEARGESDLDYLAGITGTALAELFVPTEDAWSATLRRFGFFLGKFIYLMDAAEDLDKDTKKGSFNPLIAYQSREDYAAFRADLLTSTLAEAAACFERLPIVEHAEILRHILYSGIWLHYDRLTAAERKEQEKHGSVQGARR